MFEEEENVVFENSPLEKYLRDVGYTDFEPEKPNTLEGDVHTEERTHQGYGVYTWVSERLDKLRCELDLFFSPVRVEESFKRDCVSTVLNSGVLNVDDLEFLQRFDPELFANADSDSFNQVKDYSDERIVSSGADGMLKYFWAILVGVSGVLLATGHALAWLGIIIVPISCYLWIINRQRHSYRQKVELLTSYSNRVKDLTSLMKKAVSLIQEMQFVFKGYTLVKAGVPMLFPGRDTEGENKDIIYPELRESLYTSAFKVITETQAAASHLVKGYPLSAELNNMFTYIGSVSLPELGIVGESQETSSRTLPLQALKTIVSLVACQQSEFLSRFLLCLSSKAHNTGEASFCFVKLFLGFESIFAVSYQAVDSSLQSIERSYQLHKSAVSEEDPNEITTASHEKANSKFDAISSVVHSLHLHLQAGCLRIQSLQALIEELREDCPQTEQDESKLETLFNLIRINLDSAMSCWEEGVHRLQALKGNQQQKTVNVPEESQESEKMKEAHVKESQTGDLHSKLVDTLEVGIDQIFEAFSEPMDEGQIEQPSLSVEDLAKEKRQMEESRHLLLELKSVLYAHSKDPLISKSGFVQPPQKLASRKPDDQHCIEVSDKAESPPKCEGQTLTFSMDHDKKAETGSVIENNCKSQNELDSQTETINLAAVQQPRESCNEEYIGHGLPRFVTEEDSQHFNFQSSVAFSVAAAALARSQNMGRTEEFFGSDESD